MDKPKSLITNYKRPIFLVIVTWLIAAILLFSDVPFKNFLILGCIGLPGWALLYYLFRSKRQFQALYQALGNLAKGRAIPNDKNISREPGWDSLGQLHAKTEEAANFIRTLSTDDSPIELEHLDSDENLGQALLEIRNTLDNYKELEHQRRWSSEGLAHFSEVLRNNTQDMEVFSDQIIRELVKYLDANQGGLFMLNDFEEKPHLELRACYAYSKKKYQEKKIPLGKGLVGQCVLERKPIILAKVPKDYVTITSGLGEAPPRYVAIYPLKYREQVEGVVEIASFQPLNDQQLTFLEKVCESIASTLAMFRGGARTQQLLENSQELAQELREREEKMQIHLEELALAQQKMKSNQAELEGILRAMDSSLIVGYFRADGQLISANQNFSKLLGDSLENSNVRERVKNNFEQSIPGLWTKVCNGHEVSGDILFWNPQNEEVWINASLSAIDTAEDQTEKILLLGTDITQKKLVLEKLSLVADNTDNSVVIADKHGKIEYVNDGFSKLTGYQLDEVIGQKPGKILQGPNTDPETVRRIRKKIIGGVPFYEEILNYKKSGESYWISLMINPVKNVRGQIERFVSIQTNVTTIKEQTLDYNYKLEAISKSNAVVEFTKEGEIVEANSIFLEVTGYSREEIIGQPFRFLLPEEELEKPQTQMMWDNLQAGTFFSGEFKQKSEKGKDLWLSGTYNPIFDLEGNLQKIIMFAQFTTREKEKQQELNNLVQALNSAVLTIEMDTQGQLKKANQRFLKEMGYKRLEISRMQLQDILSPKSDVPILEKIDESPNYQLSLFTKEKQAKPYRGLFAKLPSNAEQESKIILILTEQ